MRRVKSRLFSNRLFFVVAGYIVKDIRFFIKLNDKKEEIKEWPEEIGFGESNPTVFR